MDFLYTEPQLNDLGYIPGEVATPVKHTGKGRVGHRGKYTNREKVEIEVEKSGTFSIGNYLRQCRASEKRNRC